MIAGIRHAMRGTLFSVLSFGMVGAALCLSERRKVLATA